MPNNLTTSLELSQKLKENGFPQSTMFYYSKPYDIHVYAVFKEIQTGSSFPPIAAPLADEIARELPFYVEKIPKYEDEKKKHYLSCSKNEDGGWTVEYTYYYYEPSDSFKETGDTLANAMARTWLYLKVNGLITV